MKPKVCMQTTVTIGTHNMSEYKNDAEENLPTNVSKMLDEEAPIAPVDAGAPIYRIDPITKIPVSKHYGKLWDGRIASAKAARQQHVSAWDEAIRYYNHDQQSHREGNGDNTSGNRYFSKRRNKQWSETENIVYSNTRAMMPSLYAKNPQVEFTTNNEGMKAFVQSIEDLVNSLANRPHSPGLNLKTHAKQAVLTAELCNLAWLEYGYTLKDQSALAIEQELEELSQALVDAKDTKVIRETEGKLAALEEVMGIAPNAGAFVRFRAPHDVLADSNSTMPDYSDAMWMAVAESYPTEYLNARYGERDENGYVKSVYEPTHVLCGGESGEDDIKNFKLFKHDAESSDYGYKDKEALSKAHRTMCWRIWDRTTKRVFLYANNKWDWPIWVENDPYGLPGFFPLRPLYFNTTPFGALARSNVTYYLDQQDGINEIHDEFRRARQDIRENILYDNRFDKASVEAWLKGASPSAHGVAVPEGASIKDMIVPKPNTLLSVLPLFDPSRMLQSVDRVSGVSDVLRNAQFKTNTTNKAIENYNSTTSMRLDEKIDAIEEAVGAVCYGVGFLCAQFMTQEEVAPIIGEKKAADWVNYSAQELINMFSCEAVGGSTQKPTSQAKKQQAMEMARILGQMIQFAPSTVLETTMTLFDDAFDELTLPTDWASRIKEEAAMAMKRGSTDVPQGGGKSAAPQPTESPGNSSIEEIAAAIDQLPPEAKIALGNVLAKGVPIAEALPEILRTIQTSGSTLQ